MKTVIVNHDTNMVVWAAQGHGKSVLTQFYKQLTASIATLIAVDASLRVRELKY